MSRHTSSATPARAAPRDLAELATRAAALEGCAVAELEQRFGPSLPVASKHRKGKTGQLVERLLGASAGSRSAPDFVELGVELKTLPLDAQGRPKESTFLCSFCLGDAERADWASSPVRAKLAHVLFVPVLSAGDRHIIGAPFFWRPTAAQEQVMRADFDDLVGLVALGHVESLTARLGRWLQLRPKAAHGRVRTLASGADGELIATIPRGFYLRARVTRALLHDRKTLLGA